mmetsp:Transcript_9224/g.20810  ORF Transcript_9224/g.20810 Transcript_9224/m.20810 type:complete len:92 (-) Transcript_9224:110-385(-)
MPWMPAVPPAISTQTSKYPHLASYYTSTPLHQHHTITMINYKASNLALKSGNASISASSSSVTAVPVGGTLLGAFNPTIFSSISTPNSAKT